MKPQNRVYTIYDKKGTHEEKEWGATLLILSIHSSNVTKHTHSLSQGTRSNHMLSTVILKNLTLKSTRIKGHVRVWLTKNLLRHRT